MKLFKTLLFPVLFILVYISLIITVLFGTGDISDIGTTIGLQISLIILGVIAIQTIPYRYRHRLMGSLFTIGLCLSAIAIGLGEIQHSIFIFCTHIVFIFYVRERYNLISSSKSFYLRRSAHRGLGTIALLLSITYTGTLRNIDTGIDLNCDQLHKQTLGLITTYLPTIQYNTGILSTIKNIESVGTQSFGQLLGISSNSGQLGLGKNLSGQKSIALILSGSIISRQDNIYHIGTGSITSGDILASLSGQIQHSGLLTSLFSYQQNLLNTLVNNQELIDGKICDVTLEHIKTISQNNDVKIVVFVLLVLWLSFFMRSLMFIIGIINFILLWILFSTKRFITTTSQENCEHIDV